MKKVLLTSAVALAAFSTVQAVSANSEVSTKKETTEFVNGIKVEKTENFKYPWKFIRNSS